MSVNFNNLKPWKDIKDVTVDGEAMVWIPKFYVKTGTYDSGDYSGCKYWQVSPFAKSGFRIHPAFVYNGVVKNGVYIGKYMTYNKGNNIPGSAENQSMWACFFDDIKAYISARNTQSSGAKAGWHMMTIYEWAAIQFLCLIETGHSDVERLIGTATGYAITGTSNAKWRGLNDLWANEGKSTYIDGLKAGDNGVLQILKSNNDGTYVSTGVTTLGGDISDVSNAIGTDFNLGDVFIQSKNDSGKTFGNYNQGYGSGLATVGGYCVYIDWSGMVIGHGDMFALSGTSYTNSDNFNCFSRLAKYDI